MFNVLCTSHVKIQSEGGQTLIQGHLDEKHMVNVWMNEENKLSLKRIFVLERYILDLKEQEVLFQVKYFHDFLRALIVWQHINSFKLLHHQASARRQKSAYYISLSYFLQDPIFS